MSMKMGTKVLHGIKMGIRPEKWKEIKETRLGTKFKWKTEK